MQLILSQKSIQFLHIGCFVFNLTYQNLSPEIFFISSTHVNFRLACTIFLSSFREIKNIAWYTQNPNARLSRYRQSFLYFAGILHSQMTLNTCFGKKISFEISFLELPLSFFQFSLMCQLSTKGFFSFGDFSFVPIDIFF